MKRINTKLLAILAIAAVIVMVGVHVVHGIQTRRRADSLLKRAEDTKATDRTSALWLFDRYRSYKPDDKEHNAEYALLLADEVKDKLDERRYSDAIDALQDAIANSENPAELQRKQIELNIAFRQIATAQSGLKRLKEQGKSDAHDDLLLAQCYIGAAHYLDAVKLLETLVGYESAAKKFDASKATAPHELDAYAMLAGVLRDKVTDAEMPDRHELADQVLAQLVADNPDSAKAVLIQAQEFVYDRSFDKAKAGLEKALVLAPTDAQVLAGSIQMALSSGDFTAADEMITKAIGLYPNDERFYRFSAQVAAAQKNMKEAKERLDAGLKVLPNSVALLEMYFELQLQTNDYDGAKTTLKKLASSRLRPENQEYLEACLAIAQGNYREAVQQLEHLRGTMGKNAALMHDVDVRLMNCYLLLNQPDKALTEAGNLHDTQEGEFGTAAALMALGKTEDALKHFERIAHWLEQNNSAAVPGVMKHILDLRIAEQMHKPKADRDWSAVDELFAKMRDQGILRDPSASLVEINILTRKEETEKAHQMMQALLQQYPHDASVVVTAVAIALQERKPAEALQIINAAPEDVRQDPRMFFGRIDALFVAGGKKDDVKAGVVAIASDVEKLSQDKRLQLYPALSNAYARLGELQSAKEVLAHAVELDPHNPELQILRFELALNMNDLAEMKQIQQSFEKEEINDPAQAKLMQAAVLISSVMQELNQKPNGLRPPITLEDAQKRTLIQSRSLLQDVNNLRPGWAEQPKWVEQIDILENKPDDAIRDLRQILDLGQPNSQLIKQLVGLLYQRHRNEEALQLLETYGSLLTGDAEMDRIQAMLDLDTGHPQAALDKMKGQLSDDSVNPNDHLLHGQLLFRAGKLGEAEDELRKTIDLSPELPDAWLELIQVKVAEKKADEALQVLQEAQIKLPEDQRALVLARGYEALNDAVQAEQYYLSALAASPNSLPLLQAMATFYLKCNLIEKAQKYLDQILSSTPTQPADKESYAWARRVKAEIMTKSGDYRQFVKAMELLSSVSETPTADDLTARIQLLFDRGDPASSRQALRLLDELKKLRPLNSRERLMLAKLYEQVDNWPAAREEMLALLAEPKPDPAIYMTFVEMLLRRNSPDEAVTWLQPLQTMGLQNTPQVALSARTLAMQGHSSQAAALLLRLLPTERPLPQEQWPLLRQVANDLNQIGEYDQAEKLLKEDVSYEPAQLPNLALFYAGRGKVDLALNLCEQNRKRISPALMIQIGLTALHQTINPPTPEQTKHVEQWLDQAIQEDPDNWQFQRELADLRDFQHRTDDAEKLYRGLLARTDIPADQRAIILNNLADLLALQGRDKDEAIKFIDEAINTFGPQSDMLDTRGIIYLLKGDTQQALADLSDCVIATEPKPIQYIHLAMAQAKSKDESTARASLKRAQELKFNPDDLMGWEKPEYQALLKQLNISM